NLSLRSAPWARVSKNGNVRIPRPSFETHRWLDAPQDEVRRTKRSSSLHILVLGAAGMVGRKLTERLLRDGRLGKTDISKMTLQDVVAPATPEKPGFPVETVTRD